MRSLSLDGSLSRSLLATLAGLVKDPMQDKKRRFGAEAGSEEYERAYVREQFLSRVRGGMGPFFPDILGKDVLELGCGHGGISVYMAAVGARRVVGVDINEANLRYGRELAADCESRGVVLDNLELRVMDCHALDFPDESLDVVVADNLMEHVTDPARVLAECRRVVRPGGKVVVPKFSSIWSKHGLHLKNGLRVPWANLVFSEKVIVDVVRERAERAPALFDIYPGLREGATSVRDLRPHRDLNTITYAEFLATVEQVGLTVDEFIVFPTLTGRVARKLVNLPRGAVLLDVLSTGAGALLSKPELSV